MNDKTFTLDEVRAAFQRLEDHAAAQGVDAACLWTIHAAAEDGLRILTGEWTPEGDAPEEDEDELRRAALAARTAAAFDAAVLPLLGTFNDQLQVAAAKGAIDPAWAATPAGNESMLAALETYAEKHSGAMSRGASRAEAVTFALMEARRVYQRLGTE